jgi:propanol-preferring alcohol dehydrogenase
VAHSFLPDGSAHCGRRVAAQASASDTGAPNVGEIVEGSATELPVGTRVGVSWIGGVDGTCPYCRRGQENLCDAPTFTGYTVHGGYAEYTLVRSDFLFPLPEALDDLQAAPLLCAGIIGFRSLRVAGVEPGERVGLFGFGASAHLAIAVLRSWNCEVYVATRGASHRRFAASLGAAWVGSETDQPPVELDRAITFAPSGEVVLRALSSLRKGGIVAINAIHLDHMPAFDYDRLLWGERQIRSVANMTRADARDFLQVASALGLRPLGCGHFRQRRRGSSAHNCWCCRERRRDGVVRATVGVTM